MAWSYQGAFGSGWQGNNRLECRWYYQNVNASARTVEVLSETYLQTAAGWWIDASFSGNARVGVDGGGSTRQYSNPGGATTYFTGYSRTLSYNANGELVVQVGGWLQANNVVTFAQSAYIDVALPSIAPLATSGLSVSRTSDTQHVLSWSVPAGVSYTNVVVQRATDGGAWQEVGRPSGNASSWTDLTTVANRRYQYRVAGNRSGRQSAWSNTVEVLTTPAPPTSVAAVKVGSDIEVTATGLPPYATAYDVYDGASLVGSDVVAFPWLHVAPNAAVTHTYTVRAKRGVLVSADSVPSNTVQLLTAPNAPTGLAPNGGVAASDVAVPFAWTHNSVDTTAQTVYELRHRPVSGAWTTVSGTTAQNRDVSLAVGDFEWQVRTKGQHPDWSAWSAVATVTVVTRPGVAVTQPDTGWDQPVLPVEWSWLQAQGRPQSGWRVELLDSVGQRVEFREGSGAQTSFTLETRLTHDTFYTVRVQAATGTVWSAWAVQSFTVAFVAPADVSVVSQWDEGAGSMGLALSEGRGPVVGPVTNLFTNPNLVGDGTWAEVRRNLFKRSTATAGWSSWAGTSGAGAITYLSGSGHPYVDTFARLTITTPSSSGGSSGLLTSASDALVVPGESYAFRISHRNNQTANVADIRMEVKWFLGTTQVGPSITVNSAFQGAGIWHHMSNLLVAPSGVDRVQVTSLTAFSTPLPVGATLDATAAMVCPSPVMVDYFDGSSPQGSVDPDMRQRWLGAANASESVMEIENVAGMITANCVAGVSTKAGKPAVRLIPTGASKSSYFYFSIPAGARASGTLMGTAHIDAPILDSPSELMRITAHSPFAGSPQPPNTAGAHPSRVVFSDLTSTYQGRFRHGGSQGSGDVWWTDIGLFAGTYDGPAFTPGERFTWNGSLLYADWDGTVDNSTSTGTMVPEVETVTIERSIDGVTWVPWRTGLTLDEVANLTDYESLSYGVTRYRVTGGALSGAASIVVHEAVSDSGAFWLSGGSSFEIAERLPFDPGIEISSARARALKQYAGRSMPVVYAGEHVSRSVAVSGMTTDEPMQGEITAAVEALGRIAQAQHPVHMFRDPDGRRIYGALSEIATSRENVTHGEIKDWNGVWGYNFTLTETGR